MPIKVDCPSCGHRYQVGDAMAGKKVKCKACGGIIAIPSGDEDDFDFSAIDVTEPETSVPQRPAKARPAPRAFEEDDDENPIDAEADAEPETSAEPSVAPAFAGAELLETFLPILLAAGGLGWMAAQAFHTEDAVHGWVGPFRAAIYLLIYAAVVFPFVMIGVRAAGRKAYFPMPTAYVWRAFATFCLPASFAAIFTLINPSIAMFIIGIVIGMVVSIGSFIFLFNLRQQQIGKAIAPVTSFVLVGTVLGALVLFGVHFLVKASLSVAKTESEYKDSPVGPQFAWNPPPVEESPKKKKSLPTPLAVDTSATQPATEPATQPVVAMTQPAEAALPTTQLAIAVPPPVTQPTVSVTQPVAPPKPSFSSLLTEAPAVLPLGDFVDAFLPNQNSGATILTLLTHANFGDAFELWTSVNDDPVKSESFDAQPRTNDHAGIIVNAKGNMMARVVDFPKVGIEVRPLTGDANADQAKIRHIDPDASRGDDVSLIGFSGKDFVVALGGDGLLEIYDPSKPSTGAGSQRARNAINLSGVPLNAHSNIAISPDARTAATFRHNENSNGGPVGNYLVINGISIGNVFQNNILTTVQPERPAIVNGLSISPDGTRVAMLYQENQAGLIQIFHLPDGKQVATHIFTGQIGNPINDFRGSALDWLPDATGFLVNGRYIIDTADFSVIGDLGIENVKSQHVVDRQSLVLLTRDSSNKPRVLLAKLDATKFRASTAKSDSHVH